MAILGAQGLGLALGRELHQAGVVVFIDADPQQCQVAQQEGFTVVFGDALQERTLRRIPIALVGTAIGATFNDNLNSQFVRLARQTFGVLRGLVLVDSMDGDRPPEHVTNYGADVLFDGAHDQGRWDVRWCQGDVEIEQLEFAGEVQATPASQSPESVGGEARHRPFVLLTLERGGRVGPLSLSQTPKAGDRAAVAIYSWQREQALAQLVAAGWQPGPAQSQSAAQDASQTTTYSS